MKTVFLLSYVPNPRMNKRIDVARQLGEVVVICVRRASQDIWEPAHKGIVHEIIPIDLPSSKHTIKRILASLRYAKQAHRLLVRHQPMIIYTEGFDSLVIADSYAHMHSNCKIIYEVADLRESFIESPRSLTHRVVNYIVKNREKMLFRSVNKLVVTSEKFYDIHYQMLISRENTLYMPNIPDKIPFLQYKKKNSGEFTVGFIGGIRYLKQMKMLVDAAEKVCCKVLFAGAGGTEFEYKEITAYCQGKDFISFTGKYQYDKDIAELYGKTDCVYAVYDADNPNVKIALPNKLYEAVLCGLPIIVAKDTYLAEIVNNWGVGVAVGHNDPSDLYESLRKLKSDSFYYNSITMNCREHKEDVCLDKHNINLQVLLQNVEALTTED